VIGEALVLAGAVLTLVAGVGTLRFSDVFSRMHALTKASAFGLLLAIAGALLVLDHPNDVTFLVLAAILHLVTSPIGNNLLARATYYAEGIPHVIDADDELAQCREATDPDGSGATG
jgi:multicomponent Na+:H+ antiporter subunit G